MLEGAASLGVIVATKAYFVPLIADGAAKLRLSHPFGGLGANVVDASTMPVGYPSASTRWISTTPSVSISSALLMDASKSVRSPVEPAVKV